MINKSYNILSLFSSPTDMLNRSHPLYKLADAIDGKIRQGITSLYRQDDGRPSRQTDSSEVSPVNPQTSSVTGQWSENAYYRYFYSMRFV